MLPVIAWCWRSSGGLGTFDKLRARLGPYSGLLSMLTLLALGNSQTIAQDSILSSREAAYRSLS